MNIEPLEPGSTLEEVIVKVNGIITVLKNQPLRFDSLGTEEVDNLPGNIEDLNN